LWLQAAEILKLVFLIRVSVQLLRKIFNRPVKRATVRLKTNGSAKKNSCHLLNSRGFQEQQRMIIQNVKKSQNLLGSFKDSPYSTLFTASVSTELSVNSLIGCQKKPIVWRSEVVRLFSCCKVGSPFDSWRAAQGNSFAELLYSYENGEISVYRVHFKRVVSSHTNKKILSGSML
jgi:hypothetical protein